jgi:hypothetical protein
MTLGKLAAAVVSGILLFSFAGQSRAEDSSVRSRHLASENASATEPASLLAIFIADDGATLTTYDR